MSVILYKGRGYPIGAKAIFYSNDVRTIELQLRYGSSVYKTYIDVHGRVEIPLPPSRYVDGQYVALGEVMYDGKVVRPSEVNVDVTEIEIELDSRSTPMSFVMSYSGGNLYVSNPLSVGTYKTKFLVPRADLYTVYIPTESYVAYTTSTDPTQVKKGFPYVYVLTPGEPQSYVTAAFLPITPVVNAVVGMLASGVGYVRDKLVEIGKTVSNAVQTVGSTVVNAAKTAWDWATTTQIGIGPFSLSVADLAVTGISLLVPGGLIARGATFMLTRIGLSSTTANAIGRVAGGLATGAAIYATSKAVGLNDREALILATSVGIPTVLGLTGIRGILAVGGTALSLLILTDVHPSNMPNDNVEQTKAELAVSKSVKDVCFDPYYSILPYDECAKFASLPVSILVLDVEEISPGVVRNPFEVRVKNHGSVEGKAVLDICGNRKEITVAGGGVYKTTATVSGRCDIVLYMNNVEVDRRTVRPEQSTPLTTQLPIEQLVALGVVTMSVATVASLVKND